MRVGKVTLSCNKCKKILVTGVKSTDGGYGNEDEDEHHDDPDDGSPRQLAGMALDTRRQSDAVKLVVENLSPLLLMATGLQSRGQR